MELCLEQLLMDTQFFIHMSLDQPSAHEVTKCVGQPSAAPRLESALTHVTWSMR